MIVPLVLMLSGNMLAYSKQSSVNSVVNNQARVSVTTLEQLLTELVKNNPEIRAAQFRFEAATKQIQEDQAAGKMPKRPPVNADYVSRRSLWLPERARYDVIMDKEFAYYTDHFSYMLGRIDIKTGEAKEMPFPLPDGAGREALVPDKVHATVLARGGADTNWRCARRAGRKFRSGFRRRSLRWRLDFGGWGAWG